jgi:AraC-like DNA-binding protein
LSKSYIKHIVMLNFVYLAVFLLVFIPRPDYKEEIAAVDMELKNYKKDFYTGRDVAKVQGGVGTASHIFTGPAGIYDIHVEYIDEDDGESGLTFMINNIVKDQWIADTNPTKDRSFIRTVERLVLRTYDSIQVEGTRDKGESARLVGIRIDYMESVSFLSHVRFVTGYALHFLRNEGLRVTIISCSLLALINLFIAFVLKKRVKSAIVDEVHSPREDSTLLQDMISYLETNYTDKAFTLQHMCDHFHLNSNNLSLYFKDHTGQNIITYIANLRLEKAKFYLRNTDLPIQSIADMSGYFNVSSFSRSFKAQTGMSPSEYRIQSRLGRT